MDTRSKYLITILTIYILSPMALGQRASVGIAAGPARIIRHTPKIRFEIPAGTLFMTGQYTFAGKEEGWRKYWKYPEVSITAIYTDFGNKPLLGEAFGVLPTIKFNLAKLGGINAGFRAGTGLVYVTRTFDKIGNPNNNVISSNVNNVTQFSLEIQKNIGLRLAANVAGHLTHYSNARTVSPNLGINNIGLLAGLTYRFLDITQESHGMDDTIVRPATKKWGGDLLVGYGISEYSQEGGPKFGAWYVNLGARYSISQYLRLNLGLEYEYNESIFQFYYQDFIDRATAQKKATKTAIYGAADLVFGRVFTRIQTGFYLPFPAESEKTLPMNIRLAVNYKILRGTPIFSPYIGVALKSHLETAQYLGFVAGVGF